MEVYSSIRYLRISPRKVRKLADLIRNTNAQEAKLQLQRFPQRSTKPLLKLIDSALSNAKNNFGLDTANLYIKKITVESGPATKRYRPGAFGRAFPIIKRTSHVTLVLDEGKAPSVALPVTPVQEKKVEVEKPLKPEKIPEAKKGVSKAKARKIPSKAKYSLKQRLTSVTRRIFQRKAMGQ